MRFKKFLLAALFFAWVVALSAQGPFIGPRDPGPGKGSPDPVIVPAPVPKGPTEPSPESVTVLVALIVASRGDIVAPHEGINPFPWVRQFRPKTAEDARALLGLAQLLANSDLSSTDLENIARDILRGEIKVGKFFGF